MLSYAPRNFLLGLTTSAFLATCAASAFAQPTPGSGAEPARTAVVLPSKATEPSHVDKRSLDSLDEDLQGVRHTGEDEPDTSDAEKTPALADKPAIEASPETRQGDATTNTADTAPSKQPHPVVAELLKKLGETAQLHRSLDKDDLAALAKFYLANIEAPVWTDQFGLNQRGKEAVAEIAKADDWGLKASDFDLPTLVGRSFPTKALADAELKTAIAILKYARFARGGRLKPSSVSRLFDQSPEIADPLLVLQTLAKSTDIAGGLRSYHPEHPQFERLRQALLDLRHKQKEAATKSGPMEDSAKTSKTKKTGKKTAKAKKTKHPVSALKLIANMERWRWQPRDLGDFYVWDDVPSQFTSVIDNGQTVFKERIVVGKSNTPTPIFSSPMLYIIFKPSWGVPPGMKRNELLPQLRNTGGGWFSTKPLASSVLKAHGLRVTRNGQPVNPDSIDWSKVNISNYHFTQPPGRTNVLGVVKFRFPNKHNVYMHDTPERHLFGKKDRTFSHGCMRVQDPVRLAEVLLEHDRGWDADRVKQAKNRGESIELETPIPVHVAYFTVNVDDNGKIDVHRDIYGLDNRLASKLEGRNVRVGGPAVAKTKRNKKSRRYVRKKKRKPKKEPFNPFASLVD